jgi:hypothetical protein
MMIIRIRIRIRTIIIIIMIIIGSTDHCSHKGHIL